MFQKSILTATVFALSAMVGTAQTTTPGTQTGPGRGQGNHIDRLATLLSLTDDQKSKATAIFDAAQTASAGLRTNSQAARTALTDAVKANNTSAIDSAANTLGTLGGQMTAIQAKAEAAFYALLTADQKAKFDALPHGGPGGAGGPGGPGGHGGPRGGNRFGPHE